MSRPEPQQDSQSEPQGASPTIAPYGTWRSAITAEVVAASSLRFDDVKVVGTDVYWIELRPQEAGRCVLMRRRAARGERPRQDARERGEAAAQQGAVEAIEEVTPAGFSVRTSVHEYGGAAYVVAGDAVFFSNFADQRVYKQAPGCAPAAHTAEGYRYADGEVDARRQRLIYVREDHSTPGRTPVNTLVAVDMRYGGPGEVLAAGHDFYAAPRLNPAGDRLCWLAWSHPQMPWTATELWVAKVLADGTLTEARCVAGLAGDESIFQPQWSPDGVLYFVSDRTGWWNLYRWEAEGEEPDGASSPHTQEPDGASSLHTQEPDGASSLHARGTIRAVLAMAAEFGQPQWVFHMSTYGFADAGTLVCVYEAGGESRLGVIDLDAGDGGEDATDGATDGVTDGVTDGASGVRTGRGRRQQRPLGLRTIETPYREMHNVRAGAGRVVLLGGSPVRPEELAAIEVATGAVAVIKTTGTLPVGPEWIAVPQEIEFPTEGGLTAHGWYYAPHNPSYARPGDTETRDTETNGAPGVRTGRRGEDMGTGTGETEGERPPLLVLSHGGPTAAVGPGLNWGIQFWTSRGFAVLDVNYGGSTGYGRAYRERLNGQWGVVDVDDCANGAQHLVAQGLADPQRLIIRGGSAGGFTTLMALATRKTFAAGASYFGLSELESFAQDTHKFEARYLDSLVGPYPARRDLYRERSALTYLEGFNCPVIFFQGLEDKIVPPSQAELMVNALRRKGLPVAYVTYAGEDHGFRQARNQIQSLENELYFYGRVLGFMPADELEPVRIENLQP